MVKNLNAWAHDLIRRRLDWYFYLEKLEDRFLCDARWITFRVACFRASKNYVPEAAYYCTSREILRVPFYVLCAIKCYFLRLGIRFFPVFATWHNFPLHSLGISSFSFFRYLKILGSILYTTLKYGASLLFSNNNCTGVPPPYSLHLGITHLFFQIFWNLLKILGPLH
jgi:hypothetical protein